MVLDLSLELKKNSNRFLMKQEQIRVALSRLFYSKKIKWKYLFDEKSIQLVNITKVILAKDYSNAKIFIDLYDCLNHDSNKTSEIVNFLNSETYIIRKFLAKELKLRRVPNLFFKMDTERSKIEKVESLLDNIKYSTEESK